MPLLDHLHPPLAPARHWESFLGTWATGIAGRFNRFVLPPRYFAEVQVDIGSRLEIDLSPPVEAWAPPAAVLVVPAVFPDEIEVQIYGTSGGSTLVAAIELVSPGNKDRPETRRAFSAKCQSYLQLGIGLVIVDVVTERLANLHAELMQALGQAETGLPAGTELYAAAYRPARRSVGDQIDVWAAPLAVGQGLPTMPLALRGGPTLPVELELTYAEACRGSRL
jgi:Protein of unknown function (DUF4058)